MARRRRIFLRTVLAIVALALAGAGVAFFLFRADPTWYRAVRMTEAEQAAGQRRLLDRLATLRNAVGDAQARAATTPTSRPAFEIEITEAEVNGVVMRWSQTDPAVRAALASFQEPHVRFLPGRVEIAGRSPNVGALVSLELRVTQTADGPRVELGRPWAGRLPLSRSLVERPGEQGVDALRRDKPTRVPDAVIDAFARLIAGGPVAPVVPLASSLQGGGLIAARVEALTVEDGVLRATLRAVEPATPSPP